MSQGSLTYHSIEIIHQSRLLEAARSRKTSSAYTVGDRLQPREATLLHMGKALSLMGIAGAVMHFV